MIYMSCAIVITSPTVHDVNIDDVRIPYIYIASIDIGSIKLTCCLIYKVIKCLQQRRIYMIEQERFCQKLSHSLVTHHCTFQIVCSNIFNFD